ncbi:MAG: hypothetical protein ACYS0G_03460 [Planctomycetota bacterium]|jgi:hypothetical protein
MRAKLLKPLCITIAAGAVAVLSVPTLAPPGNGDDGPGRLSPASLDIDTCGCPTTFGDPFCEKQTEWTLEKTTESGPFNNPDNSPFSFTVTVTEGPTTETLTATGQIVISNSGEQTPSLASVAVLLESLVGGGGGDAPGPSGNNWLIEAITAESEAAPCGAAAVVCDGNSQRTLTQTSGSNLVLFQCDDMNDTIALSDSVQVPPTQDNDCDGQRDEDPVYTGANDTANSCGIIDNDGDGLFDEDPIDGSDNDGDGDEGGFGAGTCNDGIDNDADGFIDCADGDCVASCDEDDPDDDGDGQTDEDGACEQFGDGNDDGVDNDCDGEVDEGDELTGDAVIFCFEATFDISGLGLEGPGDGEVPSEDDLRIDLLVTFKAGGKRGGTCSADVNCNGNIDDDEFKQVRTVQQRLRFDPVPCDPTCDVVTLTDDGASADDPDCVAVTTTTLSEDIEATGVEGTQTVREITGTVTCTCDPGAGGGDPDGVTDYTLTLIPDPNLLPGSVLGQMVETASGGENNPWCSSVGGAGELCREPNNYGGFGFDAIDCRREYILDRSGALHGTYRMMAYDLGSAKRGFRLYTAIDHWDGNASSFYTGCCGHSAAFTTEDVMEYSVWGYVGPEPATDADLMTLANWVLLSDVIGYDNTQATVDAQGHPTYYFNGINGPAAAAPQTIYINGSAQCGQTGVTGHGYTRDYNFCDAYRYVGVRSSTITVLGNVTGIDGIIGTEDDGTGEGNDGDPELDGVYGFDPETGCAACECHATVTNCAELTCEDPDLIEGSPACASFDVWCVGDGDGTEVGDFCSQTQGGWGQDSCKPANTECPDDLGDGVGGNVACFRDCVFDTLFPNGLVVGDPDGPDADGSFAILLTSSQAVADYLPAGGTPAALTADQTDPETTSSGVFGGQLVAATLNVAVDDAGLRRDGGIPPFQAGTLGNLVYIACVDDDLVGLTVNQVIALANTAISSGGTPAGVTISDLNDALAALNQNFVDCNTDNGCLGLP